MAYRRPPRRDGRTARGPGRSKAIPIEQPGVAPAPARDAAPKLQRLQKVLAHAGIGSRRGCEELILQGRVQVDGKVVRELGTKFDPRTAKITVDGESIHLERPVYFAVYKPRGYVATNFDPAGRPRVVDLLPEIAERVYTVGRLDESSTGLMLLTNDGELANRLAHPRYGVEKLYRAVVAGVPTRETLDKLTEGVWLAEGKVRAKRVRPVARKGEATVLELVLAEGKNREVRRMLARLGHKVMSLIRVAIGPIVLKGLKPGQYRPLSAREVEWLRKAAEGLYVAQGKTARKPARQAGRAGPAARARLEGPAAPAGAPRSGPGSASASPRRAASAPRPGAASTPPLLEPKARRIVGLEPQRGAAPPRHARKRRPPSQPRAPGGPSRPPLAARHPLPRRRRKPDRGAPEREAAEPGDE